MFDVIIIGGSYAGCSAALQVARARKKVLVVDAGQRRNRFASHSHGFLGADGMDPAKLAAKARAEVTAYSTVTWLEDTVVSARKAESGCAITLASGATHGGKAVVLALGVADELPNIPGIAERWGKTIYHCPYCHGYELNQGKIAVLATSPMSVHHGALLPDWGPTTYFTRGEFEPSAEEAALLQKRGAVVNRTPVTSVTGGDKGITLHLADGNEIAFAGLFVAPKTKPATRIATDLGCELEDGPTGPFIKTDLWCATTVPGVFAAGDAATMAGSVAIAVGAGALAGVAAHRSVIF